MASRPDSTKPKSPRPSGWDHSDEETTGVTSMSSLSPSQRAILVRAKTRKACLIVLTGGNIGETFAVPPGETILGRGNQVHVRIPGDGISRRHARIILSDGHIAIEDLESSNGTFVNDERVVAPREIRDGDKIRLASTSVLKFTFQDQLDEAFQKQMFDAALRDGLTHAFNKRYIIDRLTTELAYARRHQSSLAFLMMDLDHFKQINDRFGHLAGDRVLVQVSKAATQTLRAEDVFGRYGGEEFCVICRGISHTQAGILADRLRSAVAAVVVEEDGQRIPVTVSIGVATFPLVQADSTAVLIEAADDALYEAKEGGRNRVVVVG